MAHAEFVHLRTHSAYSLAEGAIRLGDLAGAAAKAGMPAVAVTDTNNLFGVMEFCPAVAGAGVQPIIGCQLSVQYGWDSRAPAGQQRPLFAPVVLLVQNETGYMNLMALVSAAFLESDPMFSTHLPLGAMEGRADGLIALTGGAGGPLGRMLADGDAAGGRAWLAEMKARFGDRLYVELQRHGEAEEDRVEEPMIDLAYDLDLPLAATNDCYFLDKDMYEAHDALICVAESAYVGQEERRRLTPEHRFKSAEEMKALFADLPEATANTLVIARRCGYAAPKRDPILPGFATEGGRAEADELRAMAEAGLADRLAFMREQGHEPDEAVYRERLDRELGIIISMGFPGYFLIVADFIQWAKAQEIPVGPGRGSGAGSLVAYALTITDLDPLRYGLLFERFLNPERVSMPDFDIDFCQDRRDEVIEYVQGKYGHDKVAQIITFGKLQARAVIRDVGRVLQMPYGQVDRISKLVPANPANPVTLGQALESEPRLRHEYDSDGSVQYLVDMALKLEGLYRHASTHAAGVVIGDRPLEQLVPLYRDPKSDMPVTQFSMKYVESAGLVKFDFLGLKTLTVLDRAIAHVREGGRPDFCLADIPETDERTFEMLGRGETVGVFQLESSGMRDVLRQMKPDKFEDIIAIVALYRPGPMDNIPTYISTKHGREAASYPHPMLEPILAETYGIPVYQEQVMQMAQVLSGYSLGEADLLRRAMGKKIKAEMDAQRERFVEGAAENGVTAGKAGQIFELIEKFAGYGFNKSHAAAYALIAWQTAWLKANYPAEFLAASMTLDMGNTDKLDVFKREMKRLKIPLLPPAANHSEVAFAVERNRDLTVAGIRYALAAIKNVGRDAMGAIVAARRKDGPFRDLFDFAVRTAGSALNKRQTENLARAGALDELDPNRRRVLASVDILARYAQQQAEDRASGQMGLFGGGGGGGNADRPPLPAVEPFDDLERLAEERGAIGFYLSGHPLDDYQQKLAQKGVSRIDELPAILGETQKTNIALAGTISAVQIRRNAKGKAFAFIGFSDPSGECEILCFSEALNRHRDEMEAGRNAVFYVDILRDRDEPTLALNKMADLDGYVADAEAGARIVIADSSALPPIRATLDRAGPGKGLIRLVMRPQDRTRELELEVPDGFRIDRAVRQSLKSMPGVVDVREI
ncbi:DNA polymerase III subunit alpha [Minwuia thermotolerans]|uniref:DNA polymerase III subunit alpha n=1 Tax=Minwuia thermotolerans TaxID=2056226 RepID=A0A2M9G1I0_9PROT|nr:DNA polymerase III subunit alpha [Minwuia thermotolerans]PJK29578.1 DNA polymerase III subunit alpha [Minwuia thermotolerans]